MSTLRVEVVRVDEILPHSNADKLELARVADWVCVVGKGQFKAGDSAIYLPIDSVLSEETEAAIFRDSKIKLHHRRVKTARIRGLVSQGLLTDLPRFPSLSTAKVGDDVAGVLGVTKWEPKQDLDLKNAAGAKKKGTRKATNPNFRKYTDLENIKWYGRMALQEGEEVVMTEKIHGSSARAGIVPAVADTWWKKVKKLFGLLPSHEFVFGSRNVQLHNGNPRGVVSYYGEDIWGRWVADYSIANMLSPGEMVFGEIYGDGIQKGYAYGHTNGARRFAVYDVQKDGKWLHHDELTEWCRVRGLPMVPVLYRGPYSKQALDAATNGPSTVCEPHLQPVREGAVVRPVQEREAPGLGRVVLKSVSADFLMLPVNADEEGAA